MARCWHCHQKSSEPHLSECPSRPENRMLASRTETAEPSCLKSGVYQVDQRSCGELEIGDRPASLR